MSFAVKRTVAMSDATQKTLRNASSAGASRATSLPLA